MNDAGAIYLSRRRRFQRLVGRGMLSHSLKDLYWNSIAVTNRSLDHSLFTHLIDRVTYVHSRTKMTVHKWRVKVIQITTTER